MKKLTNVFLTIVAFIAAVVVWLLYPVFDALTKHMQRSGMMLGINAFSKQETVAFEQIMEGFQDALVLSRNISVYNTDSVTMARSNDTIWRPQPYIAQSFDGTDQTANFNNSTQLSVPSTLGFYKSSPAIMTALELRDALQEDRLGNAAKQKLASDINIAVMDIAAAQGTLFVKRTTAATGFDDMAQCDAIMNEQGIMAYDRYAALSTRDYNNMASNLAARGTMTGKPTTAYEKAYVGNVASFETYKLDYANRQLQALGGGGITMSTLDAAGNYWVPTATSAGVGGQQSNVDNRYQTITVSSTTNVRAGDAFTAATVEALHHITKRSTGQLKTFRIISVPSSTTLVISPPMITAQGGTNAELSYANCVVNTKASNSALVFLNTAAGFVNPFWQKDAIELMPGSGAAPAEAEQGGVALMRGSTDQGIEVVMVKWFDINTMKYKFRWDIFFGVVMKQPEMAGLMMFSQP